MKSSFGLEVKTRYITRRALAFKQMRKLIVAYKKEQEVQIQVRAIFVVECDKENDVRQKLKDTREIYN